MYYKARVGKEWKHKASGKRFGATLELKEGDSIDNYSMVKIERSTKAEAAPDATPTLKTESTMFGRKAGTNNAQD